MFLVNFYLKKLIFFTIFLSFVLSMATASELDAESKIEIKASDKLEWDQLENKIIAYGDSVVKSSFFSINANEIVGFYKGQLGQGKIQRLIANENAVFETKKSLITISSNMGEFDINNKNLSLSENVSFIDENLDFTLTSNELNGNLEKGEFYSTKPIYFNINSGFLKSENFFYNQNDKKVIFLGRTKLVFFK